MGEEKYIFRSDLDSVGIGGDLTGGNGGSGERNGFLHEWTRILGTTAVASDGWRVTGKRKSAQWIVARSLGCFGSVSIFALLPSLFFRRLL